jgi:DNA mismatch repair protein MutS2
MLSVSLQELIDPHEMNSHRGGEPENSHGEELSYDRAFEPETIPDLLHPRATNRVNVDALRLAISLAFASGVSGGLVGDALDTSTFAPSTWDSASFANDLFLQNFVSLCFKVRIGQDEFTPSANHIVRLLASPPADAAIVRHRRAILSELVESSELRGNLEQLYVKLCRFRSLLEGTTGAGKWDANRRQLDILLFAKEVIDAMASGFSRSHSGLSRLAAFGRYVQASEPFKALGDLLRYDERLATLNLKICIGADGHIRGFEIAEIREDERNPFVTSSWRRWLSKIELFLRGYRFSDGEVMARLIDAVFEGLVEDFVRFVQLFGDIEFYLGALGFRDMAQAAGHETCLPELVPHDAPRALVALFNPLLIAHGAKAVPCDVMMDRNAATVLITGPNSGGKTRLLQSLGLTQVLAQSGVFVPAKSGRVALAPGLVVSLVQETKADQAEGRLGMELVRIRELFERLPPGAMVILDELCSGTNPSEGEEIFELVLRMLTRLTPQAFITTHFLAFAARIEREQKIHNVRFLQVELAEDHTPTYQFTRGVATTSLAAHAAARLGVTGEKLMALIDRSIAMARTTNRSDCGS